MFKLRQIFIALVFSIVLLPVAAWAQLPDKSPENFSTTEWASYSRELLMKLCPEDAELIQRTNFVVTNDEESYAGSAWWEYPPVIEITYGLIQLVDDEDQYACVLLHEFGHLKFRRPVSIIGQVDYYELKFKKETEADKFSQEIMVKLGCNPCAGFITAKKIFGYLDPDDKEDQILIKRLELMKEDCKVSMPHIPGKADPGPK